METLEDSLGPTELHYPEGSALRVPFTGPMRAQGEALPPQGRHLGGPSGVGLQQHLVNLVLSRGRKLGLAGQA